MAQLFTNADLDSMEAVDLKAQRAEFDSKFAQLEQQSSSLNITEPLLNLVKDFDFSVEKYYSVGADGKMAEIAEGYEGLAVGITFMSEIFIGNIKDGQPNGFGKTFRMKDGIENINSVNDLQVASYGNFVNGFLIGFGSTNVDAGNMDVIATGEQTEDGVIGYCVVNVINKQNGQTTISQCGIMEKSMIKTGTIIMSAGENMVFQSGVFDTTNNQLQDGKLYIKENGNWKLAVEVKDGKPVENVA